MPTRPGPPKLPKRPAAGHGGGRAAARRGSAQTPPAEVPRGRQGADRGHPPGSRRGSTSAPAAGTDPRGAPAAGRTIPAPAVERTCYEVRRLVCPRNPATCPEVRPLGTRVLCGSFEMLARFEKAAGGDEHEPEAGFADALSGLTITGRPDADPDEPDDLDGRRDEGDQDA